MVLNLGHFFHVEAIAQIVAHILKIQPEEAESRLWEEDFEVDQIDCLTNFLWLLENNPSLLDADPFFDDQWPQLTRPSQSPAA